MDDDLWFMGIKVAKGERKQINLPVATLFDHTEMNIPIKVVRGKTPGPTLFISAAIHGDEIQGVEIVRRILQSPQISKLAGTLIAVPIVNVYGFNNRSRYLPDRRDLNRVFPGSAKGSLASRVAHTFMSEIVDKCTHGIDLHSGSNFRENFPQIRTVLASKECQRLATLFGAPLVIDSTMRDASLRQAAFERNIPVLVFEGGGPLCFDEKVIRLGVKGILNLMRAIDMLDESYQIPKIEPFVANISTWVRSPESGIVRILAKLGTYLEQGQKLATIAGPFGYQKMEVFAPSSGILIGINRLPLVNEGDALFHIANYSDSKAARGPQYRSDALLVEDFA